MMRAWLISVVAMILGTVTGLSLTWFEFHNVFEYFEPVSLTKPAVAPPPTPTSPAGPVAVVVGGSKFDFGTLTHDQSREKKFVIRNDGSKPLEVSWQGQSCGMCIINKHEFSPTEVPPGGTCEVIVTYATKKKDSNFDESAYIHTNDPRNSTLHLQIVGFVTMALKITPESLSVPSISTSESTKVVAKLFGFHSDKLELVKSEFANSSTSSLLELTTRQLEKSEIEAEPHARTGLELQIQFKPGLPIGPLTESLTITALADTEHSIVLPITGSVVGDFSVYGKNFDTTANILNIGLVNTTLGATAEFFVLIKGPQRKDVKLSVGEVDPANFLQAEIGEPASLADGRTIKIPVKITIPKGTPTMNRLGNQQGKAAKLVLETTHSVSKQLPITVRFAVQ